MFPNQTKFEHQVIGQFEKPLGLSQEKNQAIPNQYHNFNLFCGSINEPMMENKNLMSRNDSGICTGSSGYYDLPISQNSQNSQGSFRVLSDSSDSSAPNDYSRLISERYNFLGHKMENPRPEYSQNFDINQNRNPFSDNNFSSTIEPSSILNFPSIASNRNTSNSSFPFNLNASNSQYMFENNDGFNNLPTFSSSSNNIVTQGNSDTENNLLKLLMNNNNTLNSPNIPETANNFYSNGDEYFNLFPKK